MKVDIRLQTTRNCGYTTLLTTQDVIYVYAVGCVVCKDDEFSSCVLGGI